MFNYIIEQLDSFSGKADNDDDITLVEFSCESCDCETPDLQAGPPPATANWKLEIALGAEQLRKINVPKRFSRMLSTAAGLDIHRDYISTILSELYNNALEHGLLKLDSKMKADQDGFFEYYNLRKQRLDALADGNIIIRLQFVPNDTGADVKIEIEDSGDGFNHEALAKSEHLDGFGHGIDIVTTLCEKVEYSAGGSRVNAVYAITQK